MKALSYDVSGEWYTVHTPGLEALESKNEYQENHSRRDDIKIIGLEEKADEKTWDDTEQVVKKAINEQLGIEHAPTRG